MKNFIISALLLVSIGGYSQSYQKQIDALKTGKLPNSYSATQATKDAAQDAIILATKNRADSLKAAGYQTAAQVATAVAGKLDASLSATQTDATAGTDNTKYMTPLRTAQAIAAQQTVATLQPETIAYVNNIVAAGGTIDNYTVMLHDELILKGKSNGWWAQMHDVRTFGGSNFAAARVALKYQPGNGNVSLGLVGTGWGENNYVPSLGVNAGVNNTTRSLETGYSPSVAGLSWQNISWGSALSTDLSTGPNGVVYGLYNYSALTNDAMRNGNGGAVFLGVGLTNNLKFTGLNITTSQTGGLVYHNRNTSDTYRTTVTSAAIPGQFRIFATGADGTTYYGNGNFAFTFAGASLTEAQAKAMAIDVTDFLRKLGRIGNPAKPRAMFWGNSITNGQGLTSQFGDTKRWTSLVAKANGWYEFNQGIGSNKLRTQFLGQPTGISRIQSAVNSTHEVSVISIGINDLNTDDATTNGDATIIADMNTKWQAAIQSELDAGASVLVIMSPGFCTAPTATKLAAYAAACATAAKAKGVRFYDNYRYFKDFAGTAGLQDGIHPNDLGHKVIADGFQHVMQGRWLVKPTLDFPSVAAGGVQELTTTVLNATVGMPVQLNLPATTEAGLVWDARVTANDVVTIRCTNVTGSAIDPASAAITVTVLFNQ